MTSVYNEVELDDFATEDLIEELERRAVPVMDKDSPVFSKINDIYFAYTMGRQENVDLLLKELFYDTIGRIA